MIMDASIRLLKQLFLQLTPLEQYALRFLEHENQDNFSELLKQQEVNSSIYLYFKQLLRLLSTFMGVRRFAELFPGHNKR